MKKIILQSFSLTVFTFLVSFSYAQSLKDVASDKGVFIGTIMNRELVNNTNTDGGRPNEIIRSDFNALVLENDMKMSFVLNNRPSNPFSFGSEALNKSAIDKFLRYSKDDVPSAKLRTRGHTMIWYNQAPNWLRNEAANWSKQQVYDFSYQYIKALAQYCGNRMDEWDVVNEALHDGNGVGPFRSGAWYNSVGNSRQDLEDYFHFCFETAREFAPNALLVYNDYSIERYNSNSNSKNGRMRSFIQRMLDRGTEIDAVGFQSHFTVGEMTSGNNINAGFIDEVEQTMELIDDLGLEVVISELDIRRCGGESDAAHKAAYKEYTAMTLGQPNCNTLLVWGISDKDSWTIPFFNCDYSLLYNNSFNRKSAYFGVREALEDLLNIGEFRDVLNEISAPSIVTQGETVTLTVDYESSGEHDLVLMLQLDEAPFTVLQQKRVKVFKEQAIIDIELIISFDVPVADNDYQFQFYLAPVAGGWDDRLSDLNKNNVSIKAGDRELKEPFDGVIQIPGLLEVENYDKGGQGVSYNDADAENNGTSGFRATDGVDIAGSQGDYSIGWTVDGEWLEYTVNVQETALYEVEFFVSSLPGNGLIGITQDGNSVLSGAEVESTGDWNIISTFKKTIELTEGESLLRLEIEKSGFNIDKVIFTKKTTTSTENSSKKSAVVVYPNPSENGIFFLSESKEYTIYAVDGTELFSASGFTIDLKDQEKGVYLVKVNNHTIRIVK